MIENKEKLEIVAELVDNLSTKTHHAEKMKGLWYNDKFDFYYDKDIAILRRLKKLQVKQ